MRQWFAWSGVALLAIGLHLAHARPNPAWEAERLQAQYNDDEQTLRRFKYLSTAGTLPDLSPTALPGAIFHASCCGEADAYEADDTAVINGVPYAVLTCNDPESCREIAGKVSRSPGSMYRIKAERTLVNHDPVNNTGHGWIWISPNMTDAEGNPSVLCWAAPPGG